MPLHPTKGDCTASSAMNPMLNGRNCLPACPGPRSSASPPTGRAASACSTAASTPSSCSTATGRSSRPGGEGSSSGRTAAHVCDDAVWCADDNDHTVRKFTPDGRPQLTLGTSGRPSDTGATSMDYRNVRRAGPPFHYPTNLAVAPDGNLYINDGYHENACVHVFSPDGRHLHSWGEPGAGPGQFHLPHGIAVDRRGTVYVADRENSRVQLFNLKGQYLSEWADVARPCQVFVWDDHVYVGGYRFPCRQVASNPEPPADAPGGRLSVFDQEGKLLARWGGGRNPCAAGDFFAPHGVCVDSRGDVYVGEVVMSGGGNQGLVPPTCHSLQKFTRREVPN
ncbi:MAG: 6-bladed beta-propeller [Gemmataceae bacterium]